MLIAGIQTLTLLDFPGNIAAIVFTAGCNFRCGFCHNPQFVDPDQIKKLSPSFIPEEKFFKFLKTRKDFLDGIVVSGGEPTIHPDLIHFLQQIKSLGFLVKLDTNGTNPDVLKKIIDQNLVDYFAMDIKSAPSKFEMITRPIHKNLTTKIIKSRDLVLGSGINHEFRTTVLRQFHDSDEILKIAEFCRGANKYTIQNFRPQKTLDPAFGAFEGFDSSELKTFQKVAKTVLPNVNIFE